MKIEREKIEELRLLFKNCLEIAYSINPQALNKLVPKPDHALVYDKMNKLVQGMTGLYGTIEEVLTLVRK